MIASSRLELLVRIRAAGIKLPLMLTLTPMISKLDKGLEICDCSLVDEFATQDAG